MAERCKEFTLNITHRELSGQLSVSHPELCKEWHSSKNVGLTPDVVSAGSAKKVCLIFQQLYSTVPD